MTRTQRLLCRFGWFLVFSGTAAPGAAQTFYQPGFAWTTLLADPTLDDPIAFEVGPSGEIYVAERGGRISIADSPTTRRELMTIPVDSAGERGLLNIALDADFTNREFLYAYYIGTDSHVHVGKIPVTESGLGTLTDLYVGQQVFDQYHNGGGLDSDLAGHIFFSIGENYLPVYSQDVTTEYGKVMRIDRDGAIPADNPYLNDPTALPEIYAVGFRNPFRLSVDAPTGRVFVGDVGSDLAEEVNEILPGRNYGWPTQEGGRCSDPCPFERPIYYYNRGTSGQAITLGPVVRGPAYPAKYDGQLVFADWSLGLVDMITTSPDHTLSNLTTRDGNMVDFDLDSSGRVYALEWISGRIKRLDYVGTANREPVIEQVECQPTQSAAPTTAACSALATDPDGDELTYSWHLDAEPPSAGREATLELTTVGAHSVTLQVSDGTHSVSAAPIRLQIGTPPDVSILEPAGDHLYSAGETLEYSVAASDGEGNVLPDSAIRVWVNLHHNDHEHDLLPPSTGAAGSVVLPRLGETSPNIFYRLYATATDAQGLQSTASRDIALLKTTLTLTTTPGTGLLQLDGIDIAAGTRIEGVAGMQRTISAPETLRADEDGRLYLWNQWSDGGERSHAILFPSADEVLVAQYTRLDASDDPGNQIANPSLEAIAANGEPAGWRTSRWGDVQSTFQFAGTGREGSNGCAIVAAGSTASSSNFCHPVEVPVSGGSPYRISHWYRSNVETGLFALYINDAGLYQFEIIATLPASETWAPHIATIDPPAAAQSMTVFQALYSDGNLAVDDFYLAPE